MSKIGFKWLIIILFISFVVKAQEQPAEQSIEQLGEHESFIADDDGEMQRYQYLLTRPLDMNKANKEDLEIFSFLHELHIANLLTYRLIHGDLIFFV